MVTITRWTGAHARILREVALRMNIYEFAAHTNLSTSTIRDMENKGERTQLRTSTQRILDETLATASQHAQQRFTTALTETTNAAGDIEPTGKIGSTPSQTPRRRHQPRAPAIEAAGVEPWNRLAHALANPGRLDEQTVEHLLGRTRDFFNWEEHIPSRQLAADLRAHISQITQLVAAAPSRFEQALMLSLGEALALTIWLAWDSGEIATIQPAFQKAVAVAQEADDGPLLACAYAYWSYVAEADSDLPAALDLLVSAQRYTLGNRNAGTRSWLAAREAEVAAAMLDSSIALRALERALTAYDYAQPYEERSWTGFFTPSRLGSMAVTTYARLNHSDLSSTTDAVIRSLPTIEVKTRAIILADVATAAVLRGDHDQGVELGHRALDQALTQEVTVARQRLRHLHATIRQTPTAPPLAELDQRLAAQVL